MQFANDDILDEKYFFLLMKIKFFVEIV